LYSIRGCIEGKEEKERVIVQRHFGIFLYDGSKFRGGGGGKEGKVI